MKKAWGYIYFLIIFSVLLVVILSITSFLVRYKQIWVLDQAKIQACYYAESALAWYKTQKPILPKNTISSPNLQTLKQLAGLTHSMQYGGFKII